MPQLSKFFLFTNTVNETLVLLFHSFGRFLHPPEEEKESFGHILSDDFENSLRCFSKNTYMFPKKHHNASGRIEISYKRMKQSSDHFNYFANYQTIEATSLFFSFPDDFNILP